MKLDLSSKKALVLGGSKGIGHAIAKNFVEEGAVTCIASRNEANLKAAQTETGAQHYLTCDFTKPEEGARVVAEAREKLGGLDILVVNTGGPPKTTFMDAETELWQRQFNNLWLGTTESIRAAVPHMKEKNWGRILLVTTTAAKEPMPGLTISNGLRSGLLGLAKSISNEIAEFGITINSVLPGFTDTERLKELGIKQDAVEKLVPMKRMARPEEIAWLTSFLASDRAAYISGQMIACDGGRMKSF